ncbi:K(+) efflux antiporter 5-like [Mangifera indica]|uniref:K(+) efflux antiporter 5-like n=1 Tax=Mangifera indica TaxID=29780 RepID=UPI001CFB1CB8|nr:K(+) efflux antiporter 5-like [Mangifera indica]
MCYFHLCWLQVLKFLMERNSISALHGQVTIGTLILQDCAVGLLFALLPVLGGTSGVLQGVISMTKLSQFQEAEIARVTYLLYVIMGVSSKLFIRSQFQEAKIQRMIYLLYVIMGTSSEIFIQYVFTKFKIA